jgi:hypothetical protein
MKITAIKYFDAIEKKDISAIRDLLDANVKLRDWETNASGIDSVLAATANIFCSAETISIKIINIFQHRTFVVAELDITINDINYINVVDIIEFNSTEKICAIRAFRG